MGSKLFPVFWIIAALGCPASGYVFPFASSATPQPEPPGRLDPPPAGVFLGTEIRDRRPSMERVAEGAEGATGPRRSPAFDGLGRPEGLGEDEPGAGQDEEVPHFLPFPSRWYGPGNPVVLEGPTGPIEIQPFDYDEVNRTADPPWNPYLQNPLKGDFPLPGTEDLFLNVTVTNRFLAQTRRVPTPAGIAGPGPVTPSFFGDSKQEFFNNDLLLTLDLFKGQQAFKPVSWRARVTPVFNYNVLDVREKGVTNIDVTEDRIRRKRDFAIQEALLEIHLLDWNERYDFLSSEIGIFPFRSDFRGFVFDDVNLGVRLFGNADNNKWQYNVAYFDMLDKDTNSLLNEWDDREQEVFIANVFRQDWPWLGYISSLSFHYNHDDRGFHFDDNGFLVSPAPVGIAQENEINSYYLGWAGEGHIGRLNVTHAFYPVSYTHLTLPTIYSV